jgi:Tfp pilus assembly protein PilN
LNSLGIDIKEDKIAVVHLKSGFRGIRLESHAVYHLEKARPLKEKLGTVRDFLMDFMRENSINASTNIFLGIPGELAIFRHIEFPSAVKENLRATLRYEMEKYIPLPADELAFDYQIVSEDKEKNRLKVLLAAVKKNALAPYSDFSGTLQHGVSGMETESTARMNFWAYKNAKNKTSLSEKEFLNLLKPEPVSDALSADFSETGIPSSDLISAFGLALKGVQNVPVQINLLPGEMRKRPSRVSYYIMLVLAAAAILSGIVWGGSHFLRQQLMLKELNAEMKRLTSELADIDRIQGSFESLEARAEYLHSLRGGGASASDMLRELTQIIPETAWVQEFTFFKREIQLEGFADSASELIPLLEMSPLFKDAVFLSTITKDKDGKERFRIGLKIQ